LKESSDGETLIAVGNMVPDLSNRGEQQTPQRPCLTYWRK